MRGLKPSIIQYSTELPNLDDCLVERPKPFRLVIWEPILTRAPGPSRAQPYCCYIKTIIFYHRPYIVRPFKTFWRDHSGKLHASSSGYEQWDQVETRLTCDDVIIFEHERFSVGLGEVVWVNAPAEPRRWYMRRDARRVEKR
ncbi:hypothetical protein DQ393_06265 [Rhizobium tropici]|uniref:Uncharacterized protein n=2 Tax=Rhizobium tropici TaxID=398 RepID=A0A329YFZ5_RHITR|nr:hypothetical protein DQ393_06265 [Rhizobium tropici]